MTISPRNQIERDEMLRILGNPMVLESRPDAWYYGGTEVLVVTAGPSGRTSLQITDWDEGVGASIVLTPDQIVELIGRLM